jgi:hypothetical protein
MKIRFACVAVGLACVATCVYLLSHMKPVIPAESCRHAETRLFAPELSAQPVMVLRMGPLGFDIPLGSVQRAERSKVGNGVLLDCGGARVMVSAPEYHASREHLARATAQHLPPELTSDEVRLRSALYGFRGEEIARLGPGASEFLQLKMLLVSPLISHVDEVRQTTIKGLSLHSTTGSVEFQYWSDDEQWSGTIFFAPRGKGEKAAQLVRHVVSSCKLQAHQTPSGDFVQELLDTLATVVPAASDRSTSAPSTTQPESGRKD